MFESNPSFQHFDSDSDLLAPNSLDIESILHRSNLPKDVRPAAITQVFERLMDAEEIARLTEPHQPLTDNSEYLERLRIRRVALSSNRDSVLVCALIRLPGVVYTVEINPRDESIVHWEWQRA
jgi:hypothetical protein